MFEKVWNAVSCWLDSCNYIIKLNAFEDCDGEIQIYSLMEDKIFSQMNRIIQTQLYCQKLLSSGDNAPQVKCTN